MPVLDWQVGGLHVWPLFSTCVVSLAILARTKHRKLPHRKLRVSVGGFYWRTAVLLDERTLGPARRMRWRAGASHRPPDTLTNRILYHCSSQHARRIGNVLVAAPLDVPATLMRRANHDGVLWFDDLSPDDTQLSECLNPPARGVAPLLNAARNRARTWSSARDLLQLPQFPNWCATVADLLSLPNDFMRMWLARQVNLARSTALCYGEVFDTKGLPDLLVMLNGGFALTVGLTAAARDRGVPVVEVQHGADSECAVTAPGQNVDFSLFNTAPDALVSWELTPRGNPAVLSVGPIGLHLTNVLASPHRTDLRSHEELRRLFQEQQRVLDEYARSVGAAHEILVSLQPGDSGGWIESFAAQLPPGVLFWVRRHGSDLGTAVPATLNGRSTELTLASTSVLSLLLARVGAHLTKFSAVTLEAAAMGIATVAVEACAKELYGRHVPAELLRVAPDEWLAARELARLLTVKGPPRVRTLPHFGEIVGFMEAYMAGNTHQRRRRGPGTWS